jgi:hypothetical protein
VLAMERLSPLMDVAQWAALARTGKAPAGPVASEVADPEVSDQRLLNITMSTPNPDRVRDTIALSGWRLEKFTAMQGPLQWAHDYSLPPIGLVLGAAVEPGVRLFATAAEFTPEEVNPFGAMVGRLYTHPKRFCRGLSIGMMPIKYAWNEERGGVDFLEQELLELSCCPVPMNADCFTGAKSAGIAVELFIPFAEKRLDGAADAPAWMPVSQAFTAWKALRSPQVQVPRTFSTEESRIAAIERTVAELRSTLTARPPPPEAAPAVVAPRPTPEELVAATLRAFREKFTAITGRLPD